MARESSVAKVESNQCFLHSVLVIPSHVLIRLIFYYFNLNQKFSSFVILFHTKCFPENSNTCYQTCIKSENLGKCNYFSFELEGIHLCKAVIKVTASHSFLRSGGSFLLLQRIFLKISYFRRLHKYLCLFSFLNEPDYNCSLF